MRNENGTEDAVDGMATSEFEGAQSLRVSGFRTVRKRIEVGDRRIEIEVDGYEPDEAVGIIAALMADPEESDGRK